MQQSILQQPPGSKERDHTYLQRARGLLGWIRARPTLPLQCWRSSHCLWCSPRGCHPTPASCPSGSNARCREWYVKLPKPRRFYDQRRTVRREGVWWQPTPVQAHRSTGSLSNKSLSLSLLPHWSVHGLQ